MPRKPLPKPAQMPPEDLEELLKSLPSQSAADPHRPAPPSAQAAEETSEPEEDSSPAVNLGSLATEDLSQIPPGMFSDEPPPGFMPPTPPVVSMDAPYTPTSPAVIQANSGSPVPTPDPRPDLRAAPGKVFPKSGYFAPGKDVAPDPAKPDPKYDPNAVNAARASLLEDAARARAAQSAASARPGPSVPTAAPRRQNQDFAVQRALEKHETASHGPSTLPKEQQYRSRISVSTAYRYDGAVRTAPDFIDRNWISYDHGAALNIPNVGMLHVGEWLVIQDILDDDGTVALTEFKIYDDYTFHSMFMPLEASAQATHEAAA